MPCARPNASGFKSQAVQCPSLEHENPIAKSPVPVEKEAANREGTRHHERYGRRAPQRPEARASCCAKPGRDYVPFLISGNLLYISGQISKTGDGTVITGQLGAGLDVETGQEAAKACALNILAQAKAALGSLDRIQRLVKLTGFVSSAPGFGDQPKVVNGASDLMVAVLGDKGRHTRAAVGVSALPLGSAVEIDAIIEIAP